MDLRKLNFFFLSHAHANYQQMGYPKSLNGFMVLQMWRKCKDFCKPQSPLEKLKKPQTMHKSTLQDICVEVSVFMISAVFLHTVCGPCI